MPLTVAQALGLRLRGSVEFEGPGLTRGSSYGCDDTVEVEVDRGGLTRKVRAWVIVTPGEDQVVFSDKRIEELGIVIDLRGKDWWLRGD